MAETSVSDVTTERERKAVFDAAMAALPDPAAKAAQDQQTLQEHYARAIKNWAAQAQADPIAAEGTFRLRESLVDDSKLDLWETELGAAGYVITRGDFFTVALAP